MIGVSVQIRAQSTFHLTFMTVSLLQSSDTRSRSQILMRTGAHCNSITLNGSAYKLVAISSLCTFEVAMFPFSILCTRTDEVNQRDCCPSVLSKMLCFPIGSRCDIFVHGRFFMSSIWALPISCIAHWIPIRALAHFESSTYSASVLLSKVQGRKALPWNSSAEL